ncbi:class I adenylate-forming enzyme family protein [Halorussus amylolyticus]|uniref:class I adenylate-forming enzyme family protein n=1 Tax=Halorussus amylolyticus TaxID=1126242 RepID=UPI0010449AC9|nr:AMP-binding protein [Halorussus amylolyticus]
MTLSLERRAALWGDRLAVADASDDRRISYADLDARADTFAARLDALGVEAGDSVAVVSRNRVEVLALLFAARRLGAALAPISHRLTPKTVERPLDIVAPEIVVHEPAQRDLVREVADDREYTFQDLRRGEETEQSDYDRADPDPERSLLYLHANGRADRVVDLPERAVEWNCITAIAAWGLGRDDCAPTLLPLSDADGLHRLALPLLYVGGRVVVLRAFDPADALAVIENRGATALFAGATEYRELVADESFESTEFDSVEWVGTRSVLPTDAREALAERAPVVRSYGRAETGPNNLVVPVERAASDADRESDPALDPDCVGRPFPDCEVRLAEFADSGRRAAGVGENEADKRETNESDVGELEVRGPVTARGYVGGEDFPEWVATGDLAYREGDDFYVLGRTADALESEENRVHPRTVERALEAHDGIREAGAVVSGDSLAAVVGDADPGELRAFVADRLPDAAVPREIVVVESLPRRPTGEPDRAKIRRQVSGEERFEME